MIHNKQLKPIFLILSFLAILAIGATQTVPAEVPTPVGEWTWPLDGNFVVLRNTKHSTMLENTDYAVKNLDLIHSSSEHMTCFGVGWHRLLHAGVDLYLPNGNTAGAAVKAVSDGQVVYVDDGEENLSIIIRHPNYAGVWSVYWHLVNVQVDEGDSVEVGDIIGYVYEQPYSGRFPEVHPFGQDDSHLHFEIRTFEDGGNKFPDYPPCNINYPPGVGYTYPDIPNNYGYVDPIQYVRDRITETPPDYQTYLPLISAEISQCQDGENLIKYNPGFEYPNDNPCPWFEVMTYFDYPNQYYYHLVDPNGGLTGGHSLWLGNRSPNYGYSDEQMLQTIRIPEGVVSLEWRQLIRLTGPLGYGTDPGDRFIFSLQDAVTGINPYMDIVIDYTSTDLVNNVIYDYTLVYSNPESGLWLSPSYSSINDGDVYPSTLRVDDVSLVTRCGAANSQQSNQNVTIRLTPLPTQMTQP